MSSRRTHPIPRSLLFAAVGLQLACHGQAEEQADRPQDAGAEEAAAPLLDAGAGPSCVHDCDPGCPCVQDACIDDVALRFSEIPTNVETSKYLGATNPEVVPWPHYTSSPLNASGLDEHVQGIQRKGRYLLLTGSGRHFTPSTGHLLVIEMGTRSDTGPWSQPGYGFDWMNPPAEDRLVALVDLDVASWHAGGLQRIGDFLAVPLYGADANRSEVRFYRLDEITKPREVVEARIQRTSTNVKAVGGVRLADGRYIVLAWDDITLDFFLSSGARLEEGFGASFRSVAPANVSGGFQGGGCGLSGCGTYQSVNFVRQCDGTLFFVGARNQQKGAPAFPGDDLASLYRVDFPNGYGSSPTITFQSRRTFSCLDQQCSFGAGAGVYVQDSTHLALYGASHWLHDGNKRYNFNEFVAPP